MNDNCLVSIIVPIYNVEKYIEKCVNSLLEQDYSNIEIILIDDGSPDKSLDIIEKLKKTDDRIVVFHQENNGVSSARNSGLQIAHGDYIMFVDGDDWVEKNYVSYFLSLIFQFNCDIGMNVNNYSISNKKSKDKQYIISAEKAVEWIYSGDIFVAVWNKIYRKSFLDKYNLIFNRDIWYGEGMLFNIQSLQYTDRVAIGEKSVYHQTFNTQSAMRKFNVNSSLCGLKSLDLQKKCWIKKSSKIEIEWRYHKYRFNQTILDGLVRSNIVDNYKDLYYKCIKNLRDDLPVALRYSKTFKSKVLWLSYALFPYFTAKRSANNYFKKAKKNE